MSSGYASEELTVMWLLLIAVVVATYFIQSYRITLLPPSSSALLLGVFFGVVSRAAGLAAPLRFSPAAFFYALLPPIVFAAGLTLKKRAFFENIGAILTYAVLGTFVSALVFGLGTYILVLLHIVNPSHMGGAPFVECLMYGAAISSIDPVATLAVLAQTDVPPLLYNLVLGESVLNDAVAIILFRSLSAYTSPVGIFTLPAVLLRFCVLAAGSLVIGVGVAMACAFLLKRFEAYYSTPGAGWAAEGRASGTARAAASGSAPVPPPFDPTLYEIAIVLMGSYLAYLVAEVAGMSGIVALFFTGICHAHYSHYNISPDARIAVRRSLEVAAFLCELFVFAYLGLQVATMKHAFDFGLFFSGVPLAVASRAANVFPCSHLINAGRQYKLPAALQRMLWAVGLRGAVAYGLIVNMPRADKPGEFGIPAIETAALLIVVLSTLVLGSATGPLLRHLDLEGKDDAELYGIGWAEAGGGGPGGGGPPPDGAPLRIQPSSHSEFHSRFKTWDENVLKPLFGGRRGGHYGDGEEDSPLASVAGDVEGPALRRPLFYDQQYLFAADPAEEGDWGSGGRAAAAAAGTRSNGPSATGPAGVASGGVSGVVAGGRPFAATPEPPAYAASPGEARAPLQQPGEGSATVQHAAAEQPGNGRDAALFGSPN